MNTVQTLVPGSQKAQRYAEKTRQIMALAKQHVDNDDIDAAVALLTKHQACIRSSLTPIELDLLAISGPLLAFCTVMNQDNIMVKSRNGAVRFLFKLEWDFRLFSEARFAELDDMQVHRMVTALNEDPGQFYLARALAYAARLVPNLSPAARHGLEYYSNLLNLENAIVKAECLM